MPVRTSRSKSGCQSCRRRKVRCDEHKPVCGACHRLQLDCVFLPGTGDVTAESARFRVRFVQSPYTKRQRLSIDNSRRLAHPSHESHANAENPENTGMSRHTQCREGSDTDSPDSRRAGTTPGALENTMVGIPMTPDTSTPHGYSPQITRETRPPQHRGIRPQSQGQAQPAAASSGDLPTVPTVPDGQTSTGSVPAFFDLNMNFDLLDDSWLSFSQGAEPETSAEDSDSVSEDAADAETPAAAAPTPACVPASVSDSVPVPPAVHTAPMPAGLGSAPPDSPAVIIPAEDHVLIQHYLNVMSQYNRIRGSGDENMNIYTQIFSNMALFYAPLYSAIMAWTGLHLGQTRSLPDVVSRADRRYDQAVSLLHQDQNVAHHFERSLATIWFALQFELLAARGVDAFCRHLEFTADLVDAHRRHNKAGGHVVRLGYIGARVLIWLGTYDARATWVGGSGRLLQNLELFCLENDFLGEAFAGGEPAAAVSSRRTATAMAHPATAGAGASSAAAPYDLQSCLQLTLQFDVIDSRIAQLHQRSHLGTTAPVSIWLALQSDLYAVQQRLERRPSVAALLAAVVSPSRAALQHCPQTLSTDLFNDLLLLSACYSVIISFHQVLPADGAVARAMPSTLLPADEAAARILRISSWVCRMRPPSPQNVWSRILFLAGSETADPAYQDWVVRTLADAELWGVNLAKTRALLQYMIHKQTREGRRVDVLDAMRQSTGLFII